MGGFGPRGGLRYEGQSESPILRAMRIPLRALAAAAFACFATAATAHPHITIEARVEIYYGADGKLTGLHHAWTFDPVYSAFLAMGIAKDADGNIPEPSMEALATRTVASLEPSDYFTWLKADGGRKRPGKPEGARMSMRDGRVSLSFALPLAEPADASRGLVLEVMDPTYFVAFAFASGDDAVRLPGMPPACKAEVTRPKGFDPATTAKLAAGDLQALVGGGAGIMNRVTVTCP